MASKRMRKAGLDLGADRVEIEQRFHQLGIVGDRIDHLDRHARDLDRADPVEIDVGELTVRYWSIDLGAGKDRVGDLFRRGAAVADVVLDAEILGRARRDCGWPTGSGRRKPCICG